MVVLAPNSSRKFEAVVLDGEPPWCMRASLPSRWLEARLRMGRGLASTLCAPSEADANEEDVVSSWPEVRRWFARSADRPLPVLRVWLMCNLVGVASNSSTSDCWSSSEDPSSASLLQLALLWRRRELSAFAFPLLWERERLSVRSASSEVAWFRFEPPGLWQVSVCRARSRVGRSDRLRTRMEQICPIRRCS